MTLILSAPPALEPVPLAEAKAHLRVDHSADDAYIASLVVTSRLQVEALLGLALITQGWVLRLDCWPASGIVKVPLRPVASVGAVSLRDALGATTALPADSYLVEAAGACPRIVPRAAAWPPPTRIAGGIEIALTAGYGDAPENVPAPLRHAILLLAAHGYENRTGHADHPPTPLPEQLGALVAPYRSVRLS